MDPNERLIWARKKAGYRTAADAAEAMGVTVSTYTSHENGTRGMRPDVAKRYAAFFRVNLEWLLIGTQERAGPAWEQPEFNIEIAKDPEPKAPTSAAEPTPNARFITDAPPPDLSRFGGPRDIPVLGTAVAGGDDDADFQFNGQTVDWAPRPPGIVNRKGVYSLWVSNDSMFPKYEENERVYVDSLKSPAIGDYVVVELHPKEDGDSGAGFIKRLVRRTPTKIVVSQFNPVKELEFERDRVRSLHRVIPTSELLGL